MEATLLEQAADVDVSRPRAEVNDPRTATVPICLVRHAKARNRARWTRPDDERPLNRSGLEQAAGLVPLFAGRPLTRLLSSPYLRCMQTLEPLAQERGLPVETSDSLAEGAPPDDALSLGLEIAQLGPAALCSHGDVIELLVGELVRDGVPFEAKNGIELKKGSVWILHVRADEVVRAEYLPPPSARNIG